MTTEPLQFAGADPEPDDDDPNRVGALVPFFLVDRPEQIMLARRPKQGVLMRAAITVGSLGDDANAADAFILYNDVMNAILTPEAKDAIEARLWDDEDRFDLPNLEPTFRGLVEHWFSSDKTRNPTGARRGSPRSRSTTGRRSTGRARSGAPTRTS